MTKKVKKREKWILTDTHRKKIFAKIEGQEEKVDKSSVKLARSDTDVELNLNLKPLAVSKNPDDLFVEELSGEVNSCHSNSMNLETVKPLKSIKPSKASCKE